jgi:hypothetical protein
MHRKNHGEVVTGPYIDENIEEYYKYELSSAKRK